MTEPTYTITQAQRDTLIETWQERFAKGNYSSNHFAMGAHKCMQAEIDDLRAALERLVSTKTKPTHPQASEPAPASGERAEVIKSARDHADSLRVVMQDQAATTIEDLCDMLAADVHGAEMQRFIDSLPEHEDKMFLQIEEWQRASYNHSRRQIKGQQVSRSDAPDAHLVWATLRWAKEHQDAQQVAPPPIPAPQECKTEAEKTAYAFGWWKALEAAHINKANTAQQVAVPQGWKLVPVVATELMRELVVQSFYDELLAAAPQPPQAVPMTNGQVMSALKMIGEPSSLLMRIVRAIEAHHGITK